MSDTKADTGILNNTLSITKKLLKPTHSRWNVKKLEPKLNISAVDLGEGFVELEGLDDLDKCEDVLNDLEHAEVNESQANKYLAEALRINRHLRKLQSHVRNVDRMLYQTTEIYHKQKLEEVKQQERENAKKEKQLLKRIKLKNLTPAEKLQNLAEEELRKRLLNPLANPNDRERYHSSPETINRLKDRPKWDNRFPFSHNYFNRPLYDVDRTLYRYYYADLNVPRKLVGYRRWEPSSRPLGP